MHFCDILSPLSSWLGLNKSISLFSGVGVATFNILCGNWFVFSLETGLKPGGSLEFLNCVIIFYPKWSLGIFHETMVYMTNYQTVPCTGSSAAAVLVLFFLITNPDERVYNICNNLECMSLLIHTDFLGCYDTLSCYLKKHQLAEYFTAILNNCVGE